MATEASKYRDEIFDLLNVHREGYHKIAGQTAAHRMPNGTEGNLTDADSQAGSPGSNAAGMGASGAAADAADVDAREQVEPGVGEGAAEEL